MNKAANKKIRYAVVGAGNIAQVAVLPAFAGASENSELVAIVSSDDDKRAGIAARYGLSHAAGYEDLEKVLRASQADAVYITLPNTMHREYTERAARVGVHVLCEKPMATSEADCEAMIRAADDAKVKLMIAYRLHFEEANLRAVDLVRSGRIGEPLSFSSMFAQQMRPGDIRGKRDVGGGALLDLGVYCINAARYLFADEPLEVSAYANVGTDERFADVDVTTMASLRFGDGRLAQFVVSQAAANISSYRVLGSKGDLRVDPAYEYEGERRHVLTVDGKSQETTFAPCDQFAPQLLHFSRCILENAEPEPSGLEGLADVRVAVALQKAAESGRTVPLPPFERRRRPDLSLLIKRPPVNPPEPIEAPSPSLS